MLSHQDTISLEAGSADELTHIVETTVFPMIPNQKGFRDETTAAPSHAPINRNSELVGYERGRRCLQPFRVSEVLKAPSTVIEGTPKFETYELNPTFLKIAAHAV